MQAYVLLPWTRRLALQLAVPGPTNASDEEPARIYMHEAAGGCSAKSGGRSRGVQQGAVHQGAIVAIVNQIVRLAGGAAFPRLVGNLDVDRVFGVVEVDDVDVKDQHGRARNQFACSGERENKLFLVSTPWWFSLQMCPTSASRPPQTPASDSPTPSPPYAM